MILSSAEFDRIVDHIGTEYPAGDPWLVYDIAINHLIHHGDVAGGSDIPKRSWLDNRDGPRYALNLDVMEFVDGVVESRGREGSTLIIDGSSPDVYEGIDRLILVDTLFTEDMFDALNTTSLTELHIESQSDGSSDVRRLKLRIPTLKRLGIYHRNGQRISIILEDMEDLEYLNVPVLTAYDSMSVRPIRLDPSNLPNLEYLEYGAMTSLSLEYLAAISPNLQHLGIRRGSINDILRGWPDIVSISIRESIDPPIPHLGSSLRTLCISIDSSTDILNLPRGIRHLHVYMNDPVLRGVDWKYVDVDVLSLELTYIADITMDDFDIHDFRNLRMFMTDHHRGLSRLIPTDATYPIGVSYVIPDEFTVTINDPPRIFQSPLLPDPSLDEILERDDVLCRPLLYSVIRRYHLPGGELIGRG